MRGRARSASALGCAGGTPAETAQRLARRAHRPLVHWSVRNEPVRAESHDLLQLLEVTILVENGQAMHLCGTSHQKIRERNAMLGKASELVFLPALMSLLA
jgi:hypothetical protein